MPLDFLQQLSLNPGETLELVTTKDRFNQLDVIRHGRIVATFTAASRVSPSGRLAIKCAANASKLNSDTIRKHQWWDDDLLNDPVEPLAELKL